MTSSGLAAAAGGLKSNRGDDGRGMSRCRQGRGRDRGRAASKGRFWTERKSATVEPQSARARDIRHDFNETREYELRFARHATRVDVDVDDGDDNDVDNNNSNNDRDNSNDD